MISTTELTCDHSHTTLVQHDDVLAYDEDLEPERIWFVCWQCDDCGAITQKPVTYDDLQAGEAAPWLDTDTYAARTVERSLGQVAIASISFMRRAVR